MKRTNLYLDERQTAALDEMARAQGVSRAALVRRLLDRVIGSTPDDLETDLAAIEESFGVLDTDHAPPARQAGERERHLARLRRS